MTEKCKKPVKNESGRYHPGFAFYAITGDDAVSAKSLNLEMNLLLLRSLNCEIQPKKGSRQLCMLILWK